MLDRESRGVLTTRYVRWLGYRLTPALKEAPATVTADPPSGEQAGIGKRKQKKRCGRCKHGYLDAHEPVQTSDSDN